MAARNAVEVVGIDELHRDAEPRQRVVEEIVGAAVERGGGDDLVARPGQGGDDQGLGRLARGRRQPRRAAFESRDALLKDVGGGVHDAGVNVAEFLQAEEPAGVIGVVENVAGGLVDGHGACLGRLFYGLATVHCQCGKVLLDLLVIRHRVYSSGIFFPCWVYFGAKQNGPGYLPWVV